MAVVKPQTPGLIDAVSAGYVALNRRLWVIVIPIVPDLYLWLGTRLSLAPLIRSLSDRVASAPAQVLPDIAQPATLVQNLQQADLRVLPAWINFVPLLLPEFLLLPVVEQAALSGAGVVLSSVDFFARAHWNAVGATDNDRRSRNHFPHQDGRRTRRSASLPQKAYTWGPGWCRSRTVGCRLERYS